MQKTVLLICFLLLAVMAGGLEFLRHAVPVANGDVRELVLGIEMFVWLGAGLALYRRQIVKA